MRGKMRKYRLMNEEARWLMEIAEGIDHPGKENKNLMLQRRPIAIYKQKDLGTAA